MQSTIFEALNNAKEHKEQTRVKAPQKFKILALMSDCKFHLSTELHAICWRYGARLYDLKKEGYEFEKKRINSSIWAWRLLPNQN
jgi:hypothetical protein